MNIAEQILQIIIQEENKTKVIAICGAADLGKSFIASEISTLLQQKNISCNHLTLDSYLMDRQIRNEKGLSGYDIEAYDLRKAFEVVKQLIKGESIYLKPYGHQEGRTAPHSKKMDASDILIIDGLHAMHDLFLPFVTLSFFIGTDDEELIKIRTEADLIKRKYTEEFSNRISKGEFNSYKKNVAPYEKEADYILFLKSKWNYKLLRNQAKIKE